MAWGAPASTQPWPERPLYVPPPDDEDIRRRRRRFLPPPYRPEATDEPPTATTNEPPVAEPAPMATAPVEQPAAAPALRLMTAQPPIETPPTLNQGLTAADMGGAPPPVAKSLNRVDAYRQSHGTFDPSTGEWTPKHMSRLKAVGLAALRGLGYGPGGAIMGSIIGLTSPGRIAKGEFDRHVKELQEQQDAETQRKQRELGIRTGEANLQQQQWEHEHPPMATEYAYGQDAEYGDQPQAFNRDPQGNLAPQKNPLTGGAVYGAPKQPRTEKSGLGNALAVLDPAGTGKKIYVDKQTMKPIMDPSDPTGKTPFYESDARPDTEEYQTNKANAERLANYNAARSRAAAAEKQRQWHEDQIKAVTQQLAILDQQMAVMPAKIGVGTLAKENPALGPLKRQRAQLAEQLKTERTESNSAATLRANHEADALKWKDPLPPPPQRGAQANWPVGAANQAEATEMLKRAKERGLILKDNQGRPISQ